MAIHEFIVDDFVVGGVQYCDYSELTEEQSEVFAISLRDGLKGAPEGGHCDALGLDPDGDYPIIKLAGFRFGDMTAAWWFGCNIQEPESTPENIVITSRPWPGMPLSGFDVIRMRPFINFIMAKPLNRIDGGTVEFKELIYEYDTDALQYFPEFIPIQEAMTGGPKLDFSMTPGENGRTVARAKKK